MENGISRTLHQHHVDILQERWLLWKVGFFGLGVDKRYPAGMCFLDGWTWHMIVFPS